ncbi:MAG TPA: radical SAM protein, partial [Candidatus Cloacimonas sp.]|nr:radical SAM protein [Candidatus Cloacimonas sp.]
MPEKRPQTAKLLYIPWILKHLSYYVKLNTHILKKGVPLKEILILKFPFWFSDAKIPPLLSVDITDACNLKCNYCNNPFFPHPRTMMSKEVFEALIEHLKRQNVSR